jgi:hypothetical protein
MGCHKALQCLRGVRVGGVILVQDFRRGVFWHRIGEGFAICIDGLRLNG